MHVRFRGVESALALMNNEVESVNGVAKGARARRGWPKYTANLNGSGERNPVDQVSKTVRASVPQSVPVRLVSGNGEEDQLHSGADDHNRERPMHRPARFVVVATRAACAGTGIGTLAAWGSGLTG